MSAGNGGPGVLKSRAVLAGRVEDYAWLTRKQRLTLYEAAERLGVSARTARRYEKRLREAPVTSSGKQQSGT